MVYQNQDLRNIKVSELFFVSKQTATRDLSHLVDLNILQKIGQTGKGTYYVLASKSS
jgi:ATP-dependent DNA helicase RecG